MNYCKECETCSGCLKGKKCLFTCSLCYVDKGRHDNGCPNASDSTNTGSCAVSGQKQPPTPHKHAAVIKAWADGAEVQILSLDGREWNCILRPSFRTEREYRIKPEPKPDVVMYFQVTRNILRASSSRLMAKPVLSSLRRC